MNSRETSSNLTRIAVTHNNRVSSWLQWAIIFLVASLAPCCQCLAQSAVRSFEPKRLARQLTEFRQGLDSGTGKAYFSDTHESVGDLGILGDDLAKQLQVKDLVSACSEFLAAYARLDGERDAGFVRIHCGWDLILVFTQSTQHGWRYLQTVKIPDKHLETTISVASVTGDLSQQILLHKVEYMSGTGLMEQNFVVYKLEDGHLAPVLNAVERAWSTYPWTKDSVSEESRFKFVPAERDANKGIDTSASFEESMELDDGKLKVLLKREHTWSSEDQCFLPSMWYSASNSKSPEAQGASKREHQ